MSLTYLVTRFLYATKLRSKKSHLVFASMTFVALAMRHVRPDWAAPVRARLSAKRRDVRVDRGGT